MEIILYLSAALAAIAFFILVIYLVRTLKSLQGTLDHLSKTFEGLEQQLQGVTRETTELLQKTNHLADDLQNKSEKLNSVVDAVRNVGTSVHKFNDSIQMITNTINQQVEQNKDKVSQVIQWSQVILELKDKWQSRKHLKGKTEKNREKRVQEKEG